MSKLDELIQQLCPDGVEMKTLGDICYISDYVSNGSFASLRENVKYKNNPDFAILVRFADYSNGFDESKFIYIDEHAYNFLSKSSLEGGEIIMSNVGSCGMFFRCPILNRKMSLAPNSILIKSEYIDYLFHWFGSKTGQEAIKKITSKSAMPKFNKTEFKKIQIPLPPLSVQEEIVRLLDQQTETTKKYQAKLEAELDARKKQYEEYRNQLLTFDASRTDVEWEALNDCCVVQRGIRIVKKNLMEEGTVPVFQNSIAPMGYYDKSNYPANVSYIICAGSSSGSIGFCTVPFWAADDCLCVLSKGDIDNKFIYYYLQAQHSYIKTKVRGGAMPRLSRQVVENLKFPIISLTEQEGIVNILDRMDKTHKELCKSIETEIKMRKQQYEYYRNQLLDFKKKED